MRLARTIPVLALAVGLTGASCSSDDGPTSIEIPIASIQIRSGVCAVPEGTTCNLFAEAKTADGTLIPNPVLRWSSSNTTVATVQGESSSALVSVRSVGTATITVCNTTCDISDSATVRGLIPTK